MGPPWTAWMGRRKELQPITTPRRISQQSAIRRRAKIVEIRPIDSRLNNRTVNSVLLPIPADWCMLVSPHLQSGQSLAFVRRVHQSAAPPYGLWCIRVHHRCMPVHPGAVNFGPYPDMTAVLTVLQHVTWVHVCAAPGTPETMQASTQQQQQLVHVGAPGAARWLPTIYTCT